MTRPPRAQAPSRSKSCPRWRSIQASASVLPGPVSQALIALWLAAGSAVGSALGLGGRSAGASESAVFRHGVASGDPLADVLAAFERHSPEGKVLICSGYVPEELALSKLESGEYAFLPKPFDSSRLLSTIREMVGGTQS